MKYLKRTCVARISMIWFIFGFIRVGTKYFSSFVTKSQRFFLSMLTILKNCFLLKFEFLHKPCLSYLSDCFKLF